MLIRVEHISKQINGNKVLDNVSLTMEEGQKLVIAGETGSGKSSLLKIISNLMQADTGTVYFRDEPLKGPNEQLIPGHPSIAYLSQHFELRNNYKVIDLLEVFRKLDMDRAEKIYRVCQVDHLLQRRTDQLSGGERQRIATALLLVKDPQLLVLDEPFTNLDRVHKQTMKEVIDEICLQLGLSCILVSHEPEDILPWTDNLILMQAGKIIQQDSPETVYRRPVNEYAAGLLGPFALVDPSAGLNVHGIIRPEQVSIDEAGIKAVVKRSRFYGSRYLVTVTCNGAETLLYTDKNHEPGSEITISFLPS